MAQRQKSRSKKPKSRNPDFISGEELDNISSQLEELQMSISGQATNVTDFPSLPAQPPSTITGDLLDKQLRLEAMKTENLKLQLEIQRSQLELAQLNATPPQPKDSLQPQADLDSVHNAIAASTPTGLPCPPPGLDIPTLSALRKKKTTKAGSDSCSLLPERYLFSPKGELEYGKLEIAEFVGGYLEFLSARPASEYLNFITHLQLLMARAVSYTWSSVRNFHLSVNTAVFL